MRFAATEAGVGLILFISPGETFMPNISPNKILLNNLRFLRKAFRQFLFYGPLEIV